MARAVAADLQKAFGQAVVVENRAGAGGNIGADAVAKVCAGRLHVSDGHGRHPRDQHGALRRCPMTR